MKDEIKSMKQTITLQCQVKDSKNIGLEVNYIHDGEGAEISTIVNSVESAVLAYKSMEEKILVIVVLRKNLMV